MIDCDFTHSLLQAVVPYGPASPSSERLWYLTTHLMLAQVSGISYLYGRQLTEGSRVRSALYLTTHLMLAQVSGISYLYCRQLTGGKSSEIPVVSHNTSPLLAQVSGISYLYGRQRSPYDECGWQPALHTGACRYMSLLRMRSLRLPHQLENTQ
jgi:hypothetical protein